MAIRYTVVWDESVEAHFTNAWIACDARSRAILTELANWVDRELAEDAHLKGQLRDDLGARIIAAPPAVTFARVSVTFQIIEEDRQVRIVRLVFRN